MKKVFIVHGWGGSPEGDWLPWLANELKHYGFSVEVPRMPDTENPVIEKWTGHLKELAGVPDENTFFVGHSIGCQAIIRYLAELINHDKAGGAVLVAPWIDLKNIEEEEIKIVKPWIETPIAFDMAAVHCAQFTAIFSDNDPYVDLNSQRIIFEHALNVKGIVERSKGHMTASDGVLQLQTALDEVLAMAGH